jgi:lysozyme family protein
MSTSFDTACDLVLDAEGALSTDPSDPGNWTGGKCGLGACAGTKFGISAKSYPHVDIRNLTSGQAREIYHRDYWDKIDGDQLPPAVACLLFDCAVNQGLPTAISILQMALGVPVDGRMGPATLAACQNRQPLALATEIAALRALHYARSGKAAFLLGWFRRLMKTFAQSLTL